jgi:hypothetical protein
MGDFGKVFDEAKGAFSSGDVGHKVKEGDKDGLMSFQDAIVAEGGGNMGFSYRTQ